MNFDHPPRRVLVVTLRFLGDALLSTPLVRSLKQRWPDSAIDVLVFAGTEGVFEGNPDVAQVLAVAESASAGATFRQAVALWRRYDLAVIAQTGTRPFLFGWAAGRHRIGLVSPDVGKSWWKRALLDRYAVFDGGAARVLENQRIAALLGLDAAPIVVPPSAGWGPLEVGRALGFDPTANRYAVVHPSPRWRYKQWTRAGWQATDRCAASAAPARRRHRRTRCRRTRVSRHSVAGVPPDAVVRVDGRWSLAQTADVLRCAALFVGPDTATTHLAAACGTPTVAIYGPTDPAIWGPWPARDGSPYVQVAAQQRRGNVLLLQNPDLACVPCQLEGCDRHRESHSECLDRLPAERVIDASRLLMRAPR